MGFVAMLLKRKDVTMLHFHIEDMRLSIHFFLLDSEAGPHRYVREASEKESRMVCVD